MATINLRQNPSNSGGLTNAQIDANFNNLNIDSFTRAPSGVVWAATTAVAKGAILFVVDNTNATTTGSTVRHYLVTTAGTTGSTAPSHTTGSASNGTATLQFLASSGVFNGIEVLAKLNQIGDIGITGGNVGVGTNTTNERLRVVSSGTGFGRISRFQNSDATPNGIDISSSTDGGAITPIGSASAHLDLYTVGGTRVVRIDSAGSVLVNTTTARAVGGSSVASSLIETQTGIPLAVVRNTNDAIGGVISIGKSRSNSAGGVTTVTGNDALGSLRFAGADGTNLQTTSAQVSAEVEGTVSTGIIPSRLILSTTSSTGTLTERLRIDSAGNAGLGVTPSAWRNAAGADVTLQVRGLSLTGYGNYAGDLTMNAFLDSTSTWRYVGSDSAGKISFLSDGNIGVFQAPVGTAGATTSITTGQVYTVTTLGSTSLAQWQAFFSGLASVPTVGQSITATATGTLAGGATVTQVVTFVQAQLIDTAGNMGIGGSLGISTISSLGTGLTTLQIRGGNGGGLRFNNSSTTVGTLYANSSKLFVTSTGGLDASFTSDSYINQTGGSVAIGIATSNPLSSYSSITNALIVGGSPTANNGNIVAFSTQALAADIGGLITLGATDGLVPRVYAGLKAGKLNATSGDYSGYLDIQTRNNGASLATVMRLNNNGTVGIGTSFGLGPTTISTLDVGVASATVYTTSSAAVSSPSGTAFNIRNTNGTNGNGVFQTFYTANTGNNWYQGALEAASYAGAFVLGNRTGSTAYQERLRISSVGNVTAVTGAFISTKTGVTTDAGGQIYLNGATSNRIDFNVNGVAAPAFTTRSAGTKIVLYPSMSASTVDYALGMETSNMWFAVGGTSNGYKWYGGTTVAMTLSGAGALVATGNITAFSDARLKKDVVTIDNALEKTLQLRGVYFTRNDIEDAKREVGVIAQEVQKIVPELVRESENGTLSVAYGNTIALLIESIKELNAKIDALDSRINK